MRVKITDETGLKLDIKTNKKIDSSDWERIQSLVNSLMAEQYIPASNVARP